MPQQPPALRPARPPARAGREWGAVRERRVVASLRIMLLVESRVTEGGREGARAVSERGSGAANQRPRHEPSCRWVLP